MNVVIKKAFFLIAIIYFLSPFTLLEKTVLFFIRFK
ncbi:hypothetical protein V757_08175 [Pelistega indica]|uniref:Uncharacterized protein n=1 Tax=Pelistega indica TaxID=1414851 RepID=V8G1T4_9BURK|nr:hypothetical protein V757_08175 [Pelistega indica]